MNEILYWVFPDSEMEFLIIGEQHSDTLPAEWLEKHKYVLLSGRSGVVWNVLGSMEWKRILTDFEEFTKGAPSNSEWSARQKDSIRNLLRSIKKNAPQVDHLAPNGEFASFALLPDWHRIIREVNQEPTLSPSETSISITKEIQLVQTQLKLCAQVLEKHADMDPAMVFSGIISHHDERGKLLMPLDLGRRKGQSAVEHEIKLIAREVTALLLSEYKPSISDHLIKKSRPAERISEIAREIFSTLQEEPPQFAKTIEKYLESSKTDQKLLVEILESFEFESAEGLAFLEKALPFLSKSGFEALEKERLARRAKRDDLDDLISLFAHIHHSKQVKELLDSLRKLEEIAQPVFEKKQSMDPDSK